MEDKLEKIFEMQKSLNNYIVQKRGLNFSKEEWIKNEIFAIQAELIEVLDETNWKWWKKSKEIDEDKLKEEIVDVLHFFVSLSIFAGMDANELFERYLDKNKENFDRQNGLSQKKGYELDD